MNPQQQQIVAQFDQRLQQGAQQLQALIQQAHQGAQQLIAQNPTDPTPLANALGAISQQAIEVRRKSSDALSEHYDRACAAGNGNAVYPYMKRAQRGFDRWAEDAWHRFEVAMHVEQFRAMWPYVQQSMQKPVACTRCGGPLQKTTPHKSESITCGSCKAANQVTPEGVVGTYYGGTPHYFAEQAVLDKRAAIDKFKDEWEDHRDAEHAADRDRPDEPLERLQQREKMERDYWTTYAETRVRYEDGKPDDVKRLVEARMKQAFYDEMGTNDVWRKAHGQQSVQQQVSVPAHLKNVDEWGPLDPHKVPNAVEENWVHEQLLSETLRDPERNASMLKALGYRDATHRAMVHATYRRHYDAWIVTPDGQAMFQRAVMRAMNERMKYATAAAASSGILEPIEGVSLQTYALLASKQGGGVPQDEFARLLAQNGMDQAKYERVSKAWIARMSTDTTGAIATEYSKAFMGGGQYGAAGQAAAQNMAQGQMGLAGPQAGGDPMTFDRFCEIQGAMQAWSKQGKDVNAGLKKSFDMSAMDWSNVSMYWMQKMMADIPMMTKMTEVSAAYEKKYLSMP